MEAGQLQQGSGQTTTGDPPTSGGEPPRSEPRGKTEYVVLSKADTESGTGWVQIGAANAHNRRSALEQVLGGHDPQDGDVFQVVPARSFKAIKVSVVTPPPEVKFDGLD